MAATYLPNYLAIYRDLRARPCAGYLYALNGPRRCRTEEGIIVKTSLNVIDTASSLVRACSSRPRCAAVVPRLSLSLSLLQRVALTALISAKLSSTYKCDDKERRLADLIVEETLAKRKNVIYARTVRLRIVVLPTHRER